MPRESSRLGVTVNVSPIPAALKGNALQTFRKSSTVANLSTGRWNQSIASVTDLERSLLPCPWPAIECRIYKKDTADREDLFQEILYNAWHSYPRFEGRSKFSTWLYRVALNTALHQNRKDRQTANLAHVESKAFDPFEEEEVDTLKILYKAIDQLSPLEKSIVILFLDEQSYSEIAEITGLSVSNVGVKLNRIKMKIKKIMSDYGIRRF
jgi:RNA polymerase sigma-70 factor, ECF subfamily